MAARRDIVLRQDWQTDDELAFARRQLFRGRKHLERYLAACRLRAEWGEVDGEQVIAWCEEALAHRGGEGGGR